MKDQIKNHAEPEETFSDALKSVVQKIEVNASFKAELGKQLMEAHQPERSDLGQSVFHRAIPAFGWVFALVLMALVLNWMFRSIAPPPIPGAQETPSPIPTEIPLASFDYTVRSGDTCGGIAAAFGVSVQSIVILNNLPTTCIISVNQVLKIPYPTPTPSPVSMESTTPAPEDGGYDWRGAKLYLAQPLPQSPAKAHIYVMNKDEPATEEQARALADRFGIQGEMYTSPGLISETTDYVISDGKQSLQVHSDRYFTYTSDIVKNRNSNGTSNDNAETIIREFLQERGFDFSFSMSAAGALGGYIVRPFSPDLIPMQYESFTQPIMRVTLDENSEVLSINATLMDYDPVPVGEYGIITAQKALQVLLDDNVLAGKMEFFHSPGKMPQDWVRAYPDNQPVTVYGYMTSYPSAEPTQPALILIDGVPAIGNINGMEGLEYNTFVQAKGQYFVEGDIRKFNVDSWTTNIEPVYITATVQSEGDQIILTISDAGTDHQAPLIGSGKQYPLINPPADLPLDNKPNSQLSVQGMLVDGKLDWYYIQYFENPSQSGGGGGGGGLGFYQLNVSGTPVPFPTPMPQPEANQGNTEYTVKEGDTVFAIAEAYGITPEIIVQANSWLLDGSVLTPGKTLIIPVNSRPIEYVVTENDTLASIALNFGISVDELMQSNGIVSNTVFTGQILVIPSPQPQNPLIGKRFENQRGLFILNIYPQPDGNQRKEYAFAIVNENENYYLILEGDNLEALEKYHNRPVNIWATIESVDQFGSPTARIDRFEIPFPDLSIQILKGTQKVQKAEGNLVLTFLAEDGTTYVQLGPAGDVWNQDSMFGKEDDLVFVEALVIPDETFAGYPTLRTFTVDYVIDPNSGQGNEMTVTADQPYVMEEMIPPENFTPPNLAIDKVELAYFVSNPYYQVNDPNYSQRSLHIQPVWHFHGHYEDGTEFDILIQALKQEFLLPELAPGLSPG